MSDRYNELLEDLESIRREIDYSISSGDDEDLGMLYREEGFLVGQLNAERQHGLPISEQEAFGQYEV